ncbi:putative retrotransposon gag protein [Botryosphaeria dothidea]|uniref:Retrotransposon gag protein n=1 Tax=Botryosphaeria dothidea TaxID=55169 RepID=A0A8H4J1C5_9PEZI|nr:putative retrotransposon gag protein [Botryosphaeria dothidea]
MAPGSQMDVDPTEGRAEGAPGRAPPALQTEPTRAELLQLIEELKAQNARLIEHTTKRSATKVKVAAPEKFDGDRKKLQSFLLQMQRYLQFNQAQFDNDAEEVLFASTYLRGTAEAWMEPYLRDHLANEHSLEKRRAKTKEIFDTYTGFADNLRATFNDRDEVRKASNDIMTVRQMGSVTVYATKFQQLAAYLEWSDETFRDLFYKGLKDEVKKNMITHEYPPTFQKMVDLASQIDGRMYEWKMGSRQSNTSKPRRERTTLEGGDAMALDAANRQDSKKGNNGHNNKKPKGPNPNWTDEQKQRYKDRLCITCGSDKHFSPKCPQNPRSKKDNKQTSSAQREASVASRQDNHDTLHWTACYDDGCQTHQTSKDISGWYPHEPRNFGMMTRNEEVIETDDIIDSFPLDDELVNSETGELYESTSETQSDNAPIPSDKLDTLVSLEVLAERYGIGNHLRDEWGNLSQTIWIPHQKGIALTVIWGWRQNTLWETRIEQDGKKYELPVTKETTLVERHHQGTSAREQADYDSLRELARILCQYGTATIQHRTLQWIPDKKLNRPTFRYQVRKDKVYWRRKQNSDKWTNWKQAYLQVNEWEDYMHSEVYGYPMPKN